MEEFLDNIRQNPSLFYFLIAFALLWGGGMIWGAVVVVKSLGKRRQTVNSLKSNGFVQADNDLALIQQIKDALRKTWGEHFAERVEPNPRNERLTVETEHDRITFTYEIPKQEYRELSRATGAKERIQVVKRECVLSNFLFRRSASPVFYAQTKDTTTIRAFQPRTKVQTVGGWLLCVPAATGFDSTVTVYKKFTGHRAFLMNMAFQLAHVKPVTREGLLPDFERMFEVASTEPSSSRSVLEEEIQLRILKYEEYLPEGVKLSFNRDGVWLTGEEWLDKKRMNHLVALCEELVKSKKETALTHSSA